MSETAGIVINIDEDDLRGMNAELVMTQRRAQMADREIRNFAKGLELAVKAQQMMERESARGMANLGRGVAAAAAASRQQSFAASGNLGAGIAEAARAQTANESGFADRAEDIEGLGELSEGAGSLSSKLGGIAAGAKAAYSALSAMLRVAVFVGVGLFGFIEGAAAAGDQVNTLALRTGTAAEFISGMAFAAQQADLEITELHAAMTTMNERAASAPKEFAKWGISLTDVNGEAKSTEQLLRDISDRMASAGSTSEKAAIGVDLFGRSGKELVEFLGGGSAALDEMIARAVELGGVIDTTSAQLADEFNDELAATKVAADAAKREIAEAFMPALVKAFGAGQGALTEFLGWLQQNDKALRQMATSTVQLFAQGIQVLAQVLSGLSYIAEGVTSIITTRFSPAFSGARALLSSVSTAAGKLVADLDATAKKTATEVVPAVDKENESRARLVGTLGEEAKKRAELLDQIEQRAEELSDLQETLRRKDDSQRAMSIDQATRNAETELNNAEIVLQRKTENEERVAALRARLADDRVTKEEVTNQKIGAAEDLLLRQRARNALQRDQEIEALRAEAAIREDVRRAKQLEGEKLTIEQRVQLEAVAAGKMKDLAVQLATERESASREALGSALREREQILQDIETSTAAAKKAQADLKAAREQDTKDKIASLRRAELAALASRGVESAAIEAAYKREIELEEARSDRASQTIEEMLSAGGPAKLLAAWAAFYQMRDQISTDAESKLQAKLAASTQQMAEDAAATFVNAFNEVRAALNTIGSIEQETITRIAIKGTEVVNQRTGETGEVIKRYVDHVSREEMQALERLGQRAEVVTDTIEIKTRNLADAMKGIWTNLVDHLIQELLRITAVKIISTLVSVFAGPAAGFAVGGALSVAGSSAAGDLIPDVGSAGAAFATSGLALRSSPSAAASRRARAPRGEGGAVTTTVQAGGSLTTQATLPGGPPGQPPIVILGPPSRGALRKLMKDVIAPEQKVIDRLTPRQLRRK